ncbi:MAG: outer membrane lipoprotein-sorting protein [Proteobacteria bacterium]|nr:outer membrane lipoprotein-sorting protein [Pseudomonadota bacterium]
MNMLLVSCVLASFCATALANPLSAGQIIADVDEAMNRADDQTIGWDLVHQEPGQKAPRTMAFVAHVRDALNLTSFTFPADLKGTRVLTLSRTQMYIYLPAYEKVRRIASHVTQQGFMGTNYSYEDISMSHLGDIYEGEVLSEDNSSWVLRLKPKQDTKAPYAKVLVTIDKSLKLPNELQYFNAKDTHLKTESRLDYECRDEVCLAQVLRMEDHTRANSWTELRRSSWAVNPGLDDEVFTVRSLQRGE